MTRLTHLPPDITVSMSDEEEADLFGLPLGVSWEEYDSFWDELADEDARYAHAIDELERKVRLISEDSESTIKLRRWARGKARELWLYHAFKKASQSVILNMEGWDPQAMMLKNHADLLGEYGSMQSKDWTRGYVRQDRYTREIEPTMGEHGVLFVNKHVLFNPKTNFKPNRRHIIVPYSEDDTFESIVTRTEYLRNRSMNVRGQGLQARERKHLSSQITTGTITPHSYDVGLEPEALYFERAKRKKRPQPSLFIGYLPAVDPKRMDGRTSRETDGPAIGEACISRGDTGWHLQPVRTITTSKKSPSLDSSVDVSQLGGAKRSI